MAERDGIDMRRAKARVANPGNVWRTVGPAVGDRPRNLLAPPWSRGELLRSGNEEVAMFSNAKPQPERSGLLNSTAALGVPYETSLSGRWIRLQAAGRVAYVVEGAWQEGCVLLVLAPDGTRRAKHYHRPEDALAAAVEICYGG